MLCPQPSPWRFTRVAYYTRLQSCRIDLVSSKWFHRGTPQLSDAKGSKTRSLSELFTRDEVSRQAQPEYTIDVGETSRIQTSAVNKVLAQGKNPNGQHASLQRVLVRNTKPMTSASNNLAADTRILILRKASKLLLEEDFRKAAPSSQHIEGWPRDAGLTKVICVREPRTLQRTGEYILVFGSSTQALAYREHAQRLHRIAGSLSRDARPRLIPPPPTHLMPPGAAGPQALHYTLMPPSHALSLQTLREPLDPLLRFVVEHGGYPRLLRGRRTAFEVLLWVDGMRPSKKGLAHCIAKDGEHAGAPWEVVGDWRGIRTVPGWKSGQVEMEGPDAAEADLGGDGEAETEDRRWAMQRQLFVVSFRDERAAWRFALQWHRKDIAHLFEVPPRACLEAGKRPVANAEYIW